MKENVLKLRHPRWILTNIYIHGKEKKEAVFIIWSAQPKVSRNSAIWGPRTEERKRKVKMKTKKGVWQIVL